MNDRKTIAVVDDDESVRESLPDLLRSFGFAARAFASAEDYLESGEMNGIDCLVLDVAMPGMSGPELHADLRRRDIGVPVIFITANSDKGAWPGLLGSDAVAALLKPFSEEAILDAVRTALGQQ